MMRGWLGCLLLAACGERPVHAPSATPGPGIEPAPMSTPTPELALVPASRRCGEAGDAPTELPPLLASGRAAAGSGTLRPGDALQLGKVALRYDSSAWLGTQRAGHRGPALRVEIDRAEVHEHEPWGSFAALRPGSAQHMDVGPYRIALRAGAGEPPGEVAVTVTREVCPAAVLIAPDPTPRWLWVSVEGIRQHTYDLNGVLLQVVLDAQGPTPRLDVSTLAYRQWFEPRPDAPRRVQVGAHTVTIDRVVPGAGTRFDGRWLAEDDARVHVRARIEASAPARFPAATATSTRCGEATPERSGLPTALATIPGLGETQRLEPGQRARLGPLTLEHHTLEVPALGQGPYREAATQVPQLQVITPRGGGTQAVGPFHQPRILRVDDALLRVAAEGARLRVDRVALPCPGEQVLPPLSAPVYLWLSTYGHAHVRVGEISVQALNLQLHPDLGEPRLALGSERAYLSRALGPELVGLGFTLDDHRVEITDVQAGAAGPDGFPPARHVQLRVTPE